MRSHPPSLHPLSPGDLSLPFAGLGLDTAKVRRKVSGLMLQEVPRTGTVFVQTWDAPHPMLYGYGLLLRLNRETLGS